MYTCSMYIMPFLDNVSKTLSPMHTCTLKKACDALWWLMMQVQTVYVDIVTSLGGNAAKV